jgi:hypothetical protein
MIGIGAVFASVSSGREAADLFGAASREPWVTLPTMAWPPIADGHMLRRDLLLAASSIALECFHLSRERSRELGKLTFRTEAVSSHSSTPDQGHSRAFELCPMGYNMLRVKEGFFLDLDSRSFQC